jgi:hypothetical protein
MPITINGSGTLTGISTGGLPDGCIATDDLANNAVTTAKMGSGEASGLCKAWVNFNGTGTVAIRASYNVSSITDNGTGTYTVNFTTAMADANYAINVSINNISGGGSLVQPYVYSVAAGTTQIGTLQDSGAAPADTSLTFVTIFR